MVTGMGTRTTEVTTIALHFVQSSYCNDPKFSDRYVLANSADPDQTAPRGAI